MPLWALSRTIGKHAVQAAQSGIVPSGGIEGTDLASSLRNFSTELEADSEIQSFGVLIASQWSMTGFDRLADVKLLAHLSAAFSALAAALKASAHAGNDASEFGAVFRRHIGIFFLSRVLEAFEFSSDYDLYSQHWALESRIAVAEALAPVLALVLEQVRDYYDDGVANRLRLRVQCDLTVDRIVAYLRVAAFQDFARQLGRGALSEMGPSLFLLCNFEPKRDALDVLKDLAAGAADEISKDCIQCVLNMLYDMLGKYWPVAQPTIADESRYAESLFVSGALRMLWLRFATMRTVLKTYKKHAVRCVLRTLKYALLPAGPFDALPAYVALRCKELEGLEDLCADDKRDTLLFLVELGVRVDVSESTVHRAAQALGAHRDRPLQHGRLSQWLSFLTASFEKAAEYSFLDPPIPKQNAPWGGPLDALVYAAEDVSATVQQLRQSDMRSDVRWSDDRIALSVALSGFLKFVFSIRPSSVLFTREQPAFPAEHRPQSLEQLRMELCTLCSDGSDVFRWSLWTLVEVLKPQERRSRCAAVAPPDAGPLRPTAPCCGSAPDTGSVQVSVRRARTQAGTSVTWGATKSECHAELRSSPLLCARRRNTARTSLQRPDLP